MGEGGWQRMDKKNRALPIKGFDRVAANAQDHIQSQGPMVPSAQKLPLSSRRAGSLSARQLSTRSVRFKIPWPPERKTQADCKEKEEKEEDEDEHGVASARAAAEYIIEEGGWPRMDKKKKALPIKGFDRVAANAQDHIQSQGPLV